MKIGSIVPNIKFSVFHNEDIYDIKLSDYKSDWIILFFYPADFTYICPTELEDLSNFYESFRKLDAEVISMSRDSAFVHKAWKESDSRLKKIIYPMASDINGDISKIFNILSDEGTIYRSTIIIDKNRLIKSIEINDNDIGRNIQETLRKLNALIYVSKNQGKVCPVNWSPNEDVIKLPNYSLFKK